MERLKLVRMSAESDHITTARASFTDAAARQARVIAALLLREIRTRFGRARIGYFWAIIEPIFFVIILSALFSAAGRTAPVGTSMVMFFLTGLLTFFLYRNLSNRIGAALNNNRAILTYPIVKEIDTIIARGLLEIFTFLFSAIVIFIAALMLDIAHFPSRLPQIALGLLFLTILGFGVGMINAIISQFSTTWKNINNLMNRPMFFISGVFFVPENLPPAAREFVLWNPIVHGVTWVRYGYYPNYRASSLDIEYLMGWAFAVLLIGFMLERALRMRPRN